MSFIRRGVVDKIPPAVARLLLRHDLDSNTAANKVPESLPISRIRVVIKPCYINKQSYMGVSAQKFCNGPGALPTGTPGQEPGNGASGVWIKVSFCSKFFYEIDFNVSVGVLACVSPDAVPSSPVDLIQQTGLFPKFPGVKEDFKLVGLNSSPQSGINSYRACLGTHLALCVSGLLPRELMLRRWLLPAVCQTLLPQVCPRPPAGTQDDSFLSVSRDVI